MRRLHDPELARAALVADAVRATMAVRPERSGGRWATSNRAAARQLMRTEGLTFGQAYYRVSQERGAIEALERGEPVPTARERARHYRPGQRPGAMITALLDGPPRASVVEAAIPTSRRIGRHAELARILAAGGNYRGRPLAQPGEPSKQTRFYRLVSRWAPVEILGGDEAPGRYRLLADPAAVLAVLDQQRGGSMPPFEYRRVRG